MSYNCRVLLSPWNKTEILRSEVHMRSDIVMRLRSPLKYDTAQHRDGRNGRNGHQSFSYKDNFNFFSVVKLSFQIKEKHFKSDQGYKLLNQRVLEY